MLKWSLAAEILAFILIITTALSYYDKRQAKSTRRKIFEATLWMSGISILLNMVCVFTITYHDTTPYWLNMALNSAYFLVNIWLSAMIASYLFNLLLEHVYEKKCWWKAAIYPLSLSFILPL